MIQARVISSSLSMALGWGNLLIYNIPADFGLVIDSGTADSATRDVP